MDYRQIIRDHPEFFSNNGPFKVIIDELEVKSWQKKRAMQKDHPDGWDQIGIVLDDPYIIVMRDLVEFPDGNRRGYSRLINRTSLDGNPGVAILPVFKNQVVMLHQFRHSTRSWHYEIPRGYGEIGLTAEENARKELMEEIGASVTRLVPLGILHTNSGLVCDPVSLFYADLSNIGIPETLEGIESYNLLTLCELEEWISSGKINDGFTIAAYVRSKLNGLIITDNKNIK